MIFVTVGTTLPFDDLIELIDGMVMRNEITEPVVCQIGPGKYFPTHCEYFRFKPDLDDYIRQASVVIGHGGTGTVTSLLALEKPFVAVANPLGAGDHQAQFLERLSKVISFLWTRDLLELPSLIGMARDFVPSGSPGQRLTDDLREYLLSP